MPSIAQKLCRDVVDPSLKPYITCKRKSSAKSVSNISKQKSNEKFAPTKIKSFNNVMPYISNTNSSNRVTIIKSIVNHRGVNTLITGPLKCNNDCVTLAHKRSHLATCRCAAKKVSNKISAKDIQMKSRKFIADKACAQCIETANFGNQFLGTSKKQSLNSRVFSTRPIRPQIEKDTDSTSKAEYIFYDIPGKKKKEKKQAHSSQNPGSSNPESPPLVKLFLNRQTNFEPITICDKCGSRKEERESRFKYMTKPWAITSYPKRGPDF